MTLSIWLLLGVGVFGALVSVAGLLVTDDGPDALHYAGPVLLLAGPSLLVAYALELGIGWAWVRVVVIVALLMLTSVTATHALGRATGLRIVQRSSDGSAEQRVDS